MKEGFLNELLETVEKGSSISVHPHRYLQIKNRVEAQPQLHTDSQVNYFYHGGALNFEGIWVYNDADVDIDAVVPYKDPQQALEELKKEDGDN